MNTAGCARQSGRTGPILNPGAPHARYRAAVILQAVLVGVLSLLSLAVPAIGGAPPSGPMPEGVVVEELFSLPNQSGISSLAYSPDGTTLATVGSGASVWLRDADDTYADPVILPQPEVADPQTVGFGDHFPVAYSPDGALLAVGREDGNVQLWDVTQTDKDPTLLRIHVDAIQDLEFSPDGSILVTGSWDGTFRLQNLTDLDAEPAVIDTGGLVVSSVAISPDGALLAANIGDKVGLWQLDQIDADPIVLEGHESDVGHVAFSPDGTLLASGSDDHTVRVWDMANLDAAPVVLQADEQIETLTFSPDGATVAAGGTRGDILVAGVVWLWDLTQPNDPITIELSLNGLVEEIAWRPGSATLAVAYFGGTVRLLDTTAVEAMPATVDYPDAMFVALDPEATTLAAAGPAGEVWLWDLTQPRSDPDVLAAHEGQVTTLAFSPDGTYLATGGGFEDGTVRLWDTTDVEAEPLTLPLDVPVSIVAFSPDGNTLAIALRDETVRLWDLTRPDATPETLQTDEGRRVDDPIWTLAFSPDGQHLAGADNLGAVWIWDVTGPDPTPVLLTHEHEGATSTDPLFVIAFSPDGRLLAAAGQDDHLLMWDLAHVRPVSVDMALPEAPEGADPAALDSVFTALAFSPNGDTVVAGGIDGAGKTILLVWNLDDPTAEPIDLAAGQAIGSPILQIVSGADGSTLTTATMAGAVHRWSLEPATARLP
jgi:WD40 repeat protein